jgi:hypothetical protein
VTGKENPVSNASAQQQRQRKTTQSTKQKLQYSHPKEAQVFEMTDNPGLDGGTERKARTL